MGFCKRYFLFILILILIILSLYSISKNSESSNPNDGVFIITMIDSNKGDKSDQAVQNKRYFLHPGGEYLDPKLLLELVKSTIKDFDINLNHENNTVLIYETLITETLGGQYPYDYARDNYKNFGIAQFRLETAYFLKAFIKRISEHDYNLLMSLRVKDKSEKLNLMYNVKYSIALCLIYYYQRDKNIASKAKYLEYRAQLWKTHYNTYKGKGTSENYVSRVQKYFNVHKLNL